MDPAIWWYEWDGRQAGPVPHASLLELVRSGQLAAEARVWRPGMRGWEPLRRVPEVAAALPQPTPLPDAPPTFPPPAGPTAITSSPTPAPAPAPAPARAPVTAAPAELEPVSWGALIALTIVTFGIYGLVRYYQAARAYEALAGRASRFPSWFWLHVGLGVGSVAVGVIGGPLGFITGVASLVFGVMSLLETLTLRGEALRRRGVYPRLTSDATHRSLTIAAAATIWLVFGLILAIVEGILFFQDHDAIARALAAKPAPTPAPGAAPQARTCPRCGNALAQPARFCDRCGAPAP